MLRGLFTLTVLTVCTKHAACSENFDYIIVGAGSAGSVLANRLSKLPSIKILLLEAGDRPPLISEVPLFPLNLALTKYNWNFTSVPSKTVADNLKDRSFKIVAGKTLGGTTVLNYKLFVRGNKRDYDNWAENGATGWDWNNVFPYFLKLEDNQEILKVHNGYHGVGGDVNIETPPFHAPITKGYLKSAEELGYDIGDFNGEPQTVFQPPQGTIKKGRRWGALQAFINPVRGRRNLFTITSAYVIEILIDNNKRAYGVRFECKGELYKAHATHEVLISAGVFNSPKLLMLSGIGPKDTLKKFEIPILSNLPVGQNLQEHLSSPAMIFGTKSFTYLADRITKDHYNEFLINGTGPLTCLRGVETIGFVNSKYNKHLKWPDIEILWISLTAASDKGQVLRVTQNMNDEVWKLFEPFTSKDTSCFPYPTHPRSRGKVTIRSSDPYEDPVIDFNFYSDPHDLKIMVEGMKYCLAAASTEAMKKFGVYPLPITIPGCEHYERFSDEYLACAAKVYPFSIYHYAGTCKMGAYGDPTTVVDPTLKVKGIKGLRVVDASIIPFLITGHINIPTMMIAEKAADMILYELHENTRRK